MRRAAATWARNNFARHRLGYSRPPQPPRPAVQARPQSTQQVDPSQYKPQNPQEAKEVFKQLFK